MENYRDTPLARFSTFWWGLGLIFVFGAAVLALRVLSNDEPTDLERYAAEIRLEKRAEVDAAQASALEVGEIEKGKLVRLHPTMVFEAMTTQLTAAPVAVEKPEQAIPGTPTFEALQTKKPAAEAPADEPAAE